MRKLLAALSLAALLAGCASTEQKKKTEQGTQPAGDTGEDCGPSG